MSKPYSDLGRYRHRVLWQARVTVPNPGQPIESWEDRGFRWGYAIGVAPTESVVSAQQQATLQLRVFVRGKLPAAPTDRLIMDGRTLNIIGVLPFNLDEGYTEILCRQSLDSE